MATRDLSGWLLERLLGAGAQEAEVFTTSGTTLRLQVREGKLERISQAQTGGIGIRTIVDRKLSFVYTSDFSRDALKGIVAKAIALAEQATPDEFNQLPKDSPRNVTMDIFDSELKAIPTKRKVALLNEMEASALAFDPAIRSVDGCYYSEYWGNVAIANTSGVEYSYDASTCNASIEVVAEKAGEKETGSAGWTARHFDKLASPVELGKEAASKAVVLLGAKPVVSQKVPVVFSPDAGFALLVCLGPALQGDNVNKRVSYLGERMNQQIGSSLVTIHNNGTLPQGSSSTPIDAEGVNTSDQVLIDAGVLKNFIFDYSSALRAGKKPGGNAVRGGYRNLPGIGFSNYYLAKGVTKPEEIIRSTDNGLYVMKLSGWWLGINPSSPEFSSAITGRWIRNGELGEPVSRVTVASTILDMLAGVDAVGNDLVFRDGTRCPTFRVAEMALSGISE
jgi:PmbA protein